MGFESAFRSLELSLATTIDKWLDDQSEKGEAWQVISPWVGRDLASHMAQSAILLLRAVKQGEEAAES